MRRKHFQISVVLNLKKCKICEHGFIGFPWIYWLPDGFIGFQGVY